MKKLLAFSLACAAITAQAAQNGQTLQQQAASWWGTTKQNVQTAWQNVKAEMDRLATQFKPLKKQINDAISQAKKNINFRVDQIKSSAEAQKLADKIKVSYNNLAAKSNELKTHMSKLAQQCSVAKGGDVKPCQAALNESQQLNKEAQHYMEQLKKNIGDLKLHGFNVTF